MDEAQRMEIEGLLQMGVEDLFVRLGKETAGRQAAPMSEPEAAALGKGWLRHKRPVICEKLSHYSSNIDLVLAATAIADGVGTKGLATATALVLKIGVERFCSGTWADQG